MSHTLAEIVIGLLVLETGFFTAGMAATAEASGVGVALRVWLIERAAAAAAVFFAGIVRAEFVRC